MLDGGFRFSKFSQLMFEIIRRFAAVTFFQPPISLRNPNSILRCQIDPTTTDLFVVFTLLLRCRWWMELEVELNYRVRHRMESPIFAFPTTAITFLCRHGTRSVSSIAYLYSLSDFLSLGFVMDRSFIYVWFGLYRPFGCMMQGRMFWRVSSFILRRFWIVAFMTILRGSVPVRITLSAGKHKYRFFFLQIFLLLFFISKIVNITFCLQKDAFICELNNS